ncbi:MAG: PAS domain-containing protein [Calothrix sp. FI2-JRJ7]|jgi:PAS domain S-box-containing protein|nr:PAS domain-containing protein [Calothrix sp. FI2-JRJ7]
MHYQGKADSRLKDDPSVSMASDLDSARGSLRVETDIGMVLHLADGTLRACNVCAEEILGFTAEQIHGWTSISSPWQAVHEDGSPFPGETHPAMVSLRTGQPCLNIVMGLYQPSGNLVWLNINSHPLFQLNTSIPYAVVTTFSKIAAPEVDFIQAEIEAPHNSYKKAAEAEIQRLNQELERRVAEMQTILDAVPVGITIAEDANCQVIRANKFAQSMLTVPPDANVSATGEQAGILPFRQLRDGKDIPGEELPMQVATATGAPVRDVEIQTVRSDGVKFDWWVNAAPLFDEQGAVRGSVAAFVDITELKRIQEVSRVNEERLRIAQLTTNAGTWDWDVATNSVYWSPEYYTLYGLDAATPSTYENWLASIVEEDREFVELTIRQVLEAKLTSFTLEFRINHPVQGIRWFDCRSQIFYNPDGQPSRLVGISIDISDRKQVEIALQEQTKLLQVIIDSIGDGLVLANPQGEFVIFNEAAQRMFGKLSNEESLEQWSNSYGLFLPDQQTLFPNDELPLARAMRGEYANNVEVFVRRSPASEGRWISISGYPVVDISEEIKGGVITCRDITDRKRIEEDLRQKNAILNVINESVPTPIFVKDRQGRIIYANPATLEVLAKSEKEVIGLRDCDLYPERELGAVVTENDLRIMESGQTCVIEESPDGIRTFLGMKVPYRNEAGEVIGLIGISNDITARVQLERDRERILQQEQAAREESERANRIKDEFLAVLSHELRTPLNPILGWSKLLQTGKLNASKAAEALKAIERNAKLQSQLIEDLLDVSRILRGKLTLNVAPVTLPPVINAALETVQLAVEAKSIYIQTIFEPNVGQILGDIGRLQQIICNLLSNAVKFTPEGGRVEVQLTQIQTSAQIQVIDNGKGISSDFLPHVFEHFRQEDGAITRQFGGLGLGLAIVRQLVELHGGTVAASSAGEGFGATFTVKLPLIKQVTEPVDNFDDPLPYPNDSEPLAGLRIIVVDDEPDSLDFIAFVIEQAGAEVIAMPSAIEALQILQQIQPHLIISDIGMPEMDGYMLIEQIRTKLPSQYREVIAIALTAFAGEVNERQVMMAGFQKHLAKPVDPDELVATITRLVTA